MKTLHNNDAGYISFYKDVLDEVKNIRNKFNIPNHISNEDIVSQCEFWVEEAFFEPEFDDNILASATANTVLLIFEDTNYTHSVDKN